MLPAADSSPYPEVKASGENTGLAARLGDVYAGDAGELGAVARYVYQGIVFKESYPEYSDAFLRLAKTEMHHLLLVGELIVRLGGDPLYASYKGEERRYWNGAEIMTGSDLAAALLYDLNEEQRAYSDYVSIARQSRDRYVFALLTRIALDEMLHTSMLKVMIKKLRRIK